jgi:cytochrome c
MDSFEFNKLIGGLLGAVFIVFSISLVSDAIFAAPVPEKPGFIIEAAEEDHGGGAAAPAAEQSMIPLLATASAEAGAAVFKKCAACHTDDSGGANKVGPNLWGVINRPVASHAGFAYSAGMKEFSDGGKVVWDYEHLDHFLTSPKALVKGTAMGFAGLKKAEDRAAVVAYLRTTADSPAPLPEASAAPAAPAAENASAPADAAKPAEGAAPAPAEAAPKPAEGAAPAPAEAAPKPAEPAPAQ